jgi:putative endonuclease
MAFTVYVLQSKATGRRYVGSSADINDRLRRHNAGRSLATKHGIPWDLVYAETVETRSEAVLRESYFKTGKGREELHQLLDKAETDGRED